MWYWIQMAPICSYGSSNKLSLSLPLSLNYSRFSDQIFDQEDEGSVVPKKIRASWTRSLQQAQQLRNRHNKALQGTTGRYKGATRRYSRRERGILSQRFHPINFISPPSRHSPPTPPTTNNNHYHTPCRSTRPPCTQPLPRRHQPTNLSRINPLLPAINPHHCRNNRHATATSFYSKPSSQTKAHSSDTALMQTNRTTT